MQCYKWIALELHTNLQNELSAGKVSLVQVTLLSSLRNLHNIARQENYMVSHIITRICIHTDQTRLKSEKLGEKHIDDD